MSSYNVLTMLSDRPFHFAPRLYRAVENHELKRCFLEYGRIYDNYTALKYSNQTFNVQFSLFSSLLKLSA